MTLVQLVPWLPPALEGVGGYAAALGAALARCGIDSRFLVADPGWRPAADDRGAAADLAGERLAERSAAALARQLTASGATVVLVHYANYGYQRRGHPAWLVRGVRRWRAGAPGRRLVTYFHEVYASGPPWRSSFWVSPLQRRLAARLLRASDGAATSLGLYGRMLARWRPACEVWVTPVFSTIGEPAVVPPPGERLPRAMLVFGGSGNRQRAFGKQRAALVAACRGLDVEEVLDLGPPLAELPARLDGLPVRPLGALPAAAASAVLLRSYAGFLGYPTAFLAKSTVFAAYCAHGLVPVCAWGRQPRGDGGDPGDHGQDRDSGERPPFWDAGAEPPPADTAGLAARARAWYGGHDLASQAVRFSALLTGVARVAGVP